MPNQILFTLGPIKFSKRSLISFAALLVNVTASIFHGLAFDENSKLAILAVRTLVFPVPAPDKTKRGPSNVSTAFF